MAHDYAVGGDNEISLTVTDDDDDRDVLIGGPGRDIAFGGDGRDLCTVTRRTC